MDRRQFLASTAATCVLAAMPMRLFAQAAAAPASADARLNTLLDAFYYEGLDASPMTATSVGLDKGARAGLKRRLDDYSLAGRAAERARFAGRQRRLKALGTAGLSPLGRVNHDVIDTLDGIELDGRSRFAFGSFGGIWSPYAQTQLTGAYRDVPDFLDSKHGIDSKADADAYLARLAALGPTIDGDTEAQRHDAGLGVVPPGFVIDLELAQLASLRGKPAAQTVLVESLVRRAKEKGIAGDWGAQADRIVAGSVFPALDRQIALARQLRTGAASDADAGVWRLKDGDAYYAGALANATTTTMTPDEVHTVGLTQVADLSARIDTILKAEGMSKGSVGERLTALNADPRQVYANTPQGRAELIAYLNADLTRVRALLPQAFHTLPKAPIEIRAVPEQIQDGAANGYYDGAALDGSRPAIYWINLKDTADWPRYGLPALTYHEGVPGHHLQISLSQETNGIPILRRQTFLSAYGEGWALYAEGVAQELGAYGDDRLGIAGSLQSLLFRAVRLVVDTGLHARRWSAAQATDYMVANTGFPRPRTRREIDRYVVWPGQACSYKVGHNKWTELRRRAETTLGAKFDLRAFHDILLEGSMPLTLLDARVTDWIARQKA